MKKVLIIGYLLVLCCSSPVFSAEYKVQAGDVISRIAQKTGCSIEELVKLNDISPPQYIVRKGQIIKYITKTDLINAQKWVEQYLLGLNPNDIEYKSFEKILRDIRMRNIKYEGELSTTASEVLLFAKLYKE